jgi:hypothetical protein
MVCCVKKNANKDSHKCLFHTSGANCPLATACPAATAGAAAGGTVRRTGWAGTGTAAGRFLSAAAVVGTEACLELLGNILKAVAHVKLEQRDLQGAARTRLTLRLLRRRGGVSKRLLLRIRVGRNGWLGLPLLR